LDSRSNASQGLKSLMLQHDSMIWIVGPRQLQNELIASCLEQETGAKCLPAEDICNLPSRDETEPDGQRKLVLWDCHERDPKKLLAVLEGCGIQTTCEEYVALFNVCHDLGIEERCVWHGVRGLFYDHDSLTHFVKGVRAILNGQLWLSRRIMTKCIEQNEGYRNSSKTETPILTPRERQMLAEITVGSTNTEIADKLCVSPHTVKTHLYNIYKKINASNRLQAALWATKNL
jgi:DNA-binding CsgD family transcriptional regulator